jgi:hypothetical protein
MYGSRDRLPKLSYSQAEADWRLHADALKSAAELREALAGCPSCKDDLNFLQGTAPMSPAREAGLGYSMVSSARGSGGSGTA